MKKAGQLMKKHKGITALAVVLAVLIVVSMVTGRTRSATADYNEETASLRTITTYNSFVGNVTTASEMNVYPQASQTVTEVYVSEGDEVKKGDVIAQLDTSTVEYNIAVQEAQLDSTKTSNAYNIADAQRSYDNYKEAIDKGLNSSLQSASNQVDSAYTALINAYESYDETEYEIDNGTYSAMSSYWTEKENAASALSSAESAVSEAQAAVTTAENNLASAKATLAALQSSSSSAQTELTAAQSALAEAEIALSTAESDFNTAKKNLADAEQAKYDAETDIANADEIINSTSEDVTEEEKAEAATAKETAEDELAAAEENIEIYTNSVSTAQAAYYEAYAAYESAQAAVSSAQSGVTSLEEAQAAVTAAQSALDSANSTLSAKQSAYTSAYNAADTAYNNWYNQRTSVLEDMQDNIDSALTSYNQALASYDSTELSVEQQLESYAASVDKTKATSSTATSELELENLQDSLEDYTITAPCDGTITELDLEVGDSVSSGMSVATISSLDAMEISISVDEYSILNTGEGSAVTVYIDSIGKSYEGVITWVASAATISGGVSYFEATVGFTPDDDVRVGMSVEVRLVTVDRQDVVSVASGSVNYHSDNTAYVLVQDESGNVVEKTVTLGESDGSYVEITDGLEEGDIILTTASVSGMLDASTMDMIEEQGGPN